MGWASIWRMESYPKKCFAMYSWHPTRRQIRGPPHTTCVYQRLSQCDTERASLLDPSHRQNCSQSTCFPLLPWTEQCVPQELILYIYIERETETERERHTYRERERDRQTERETDRERQTGKQTDRQTVFYTIVRPGFEHASAITCPYLKSDEKRIDSPQRHATRFVPNNPQRQCKPDEEHISVTALLEELGWDGLASRRKDARCTLLHKVLNGHVDVDEEPWPPYSDSRPRSEVTNDIMRIISSKKKYTTGTASQPPPGRPRIWRNSRQRCTNSAALHTLMALNLHLAFIAVPPDVLYTSMCWCFWMCGKQRTTCGMPKWRWRGYMDLTLKWKLNFYFS